MNVDALELISQLQAHLIETNKALIALQAEVLKLRKTKNATVSYDELEERLREVAATFLRNASRFDATSETITR